MANYTHWDQTQELIWKDEVEKGNVGNTKSIKNSFDFYFRISSQVSWFKIESLLDQKWHVCYTHSYGQQQRHSVVCHNISMFVIMIEL